MLYLENNYVEWSIETLHTILPNPDAENSCASPCMTCLRASSLLACCRRLEAANLPDCSSTILASSSSCLCRYLYRWKINSTTVETPVKDTLKKRTPSRLSQVPNAHCPFLTKNPTTIQQNGNVIGSTVVTLEYMHSFNT